ncbi:MAG: hypothetical protein RR253_04590 [Oscillospiraceae bacterium]
MKVLFLGNSHTFYNDMPKIFANICKEKGKDVEVSMQAHPGVTYGWHYSQFTELRFALMYGGFDYLIMQQAAHSPCPSKEETITDGMKIVQLARACGVTPIQVMPWAEKRDPAHQKGMYEIYNEFSEKAQVKLSCVGNVFEDVFYNHPEIDMYWRDGEHASPYGSYVIAMCAYSAIFSQSVKGLAPNSYYTYPVSEADWLLVQDGFKKMTENPGDEDLKRRAYAEYKAHIKPVLCEEDAFFALDAVKAQTLQDLVDEYSLGK